VTNNLTDPDLVSLIDQQETPRRIINPLSVDLSVLRPNLILSLLQVVQRNLRRSIKDIRIFELNKIFHRPDPEDFSAEKWSLCGVITGRRWPASWDQQDVQVDFYDLKGLLESLLDKLSIDNFNFLPYDGSVFKQGIAAALALGGTPCGFLGQLAPGVRSAFDLEEEVFLFHLDVASVIKAMSRNRHYVSLPKFPIAERDLAIVVPEEVVADQVEDAIRQAGGELLVEVRLFDVYRGKQIVAGKKGLAYSIRYQSSVKTLKDSDVDDTQRRIVATLREKFGVELRS